MHRLGGYLASATAALAAALATGQDRGRWEAKPRLLQARQEVGAAVLAGRVYVAGGLGANTLPVKSVERFAPAGNRWERVADLPTTLHHFGMAALGGRIYVVGGYVTTFNSHTAAVRVYDPGRNAWASVASLPRPRAALAAVAVGGKLYAVGGVVPGVGAVGELTEYDPATGRWATRPAMPTPREHLAASALNGKLHVAGGRRAGVGNFNVLEVYDPNRRQWQRLAPMPTARGGNGAAALLGRLIVAGGEGTRIFPETEEYNPAANTWFKLSSMTTGLHGIYPVTYGDEIWVPGGATVPGFAATDLVLAFRFQRPTAAVSVTPHLVPRNGTFTFAAGLTNPGRTRKVDIYLGYGGPFGPLALYGPDLVLRPLPSLAPTFAGVTLPEGVSLPPLPLARHPASLLPPGSYHGFALLGAADAFKDGRLEPGDLLAFATAPFRIP